MHVRAGDGHGAGGDETVVIVSTQRSDENSIGV